MSGKKAIFSKTQLRSLLNNKDSCVIVKEATIQVLLLPCYLNNLREGLRNALYKKLKTYDSKLEGILLGYENIRVDLDAGRFYGRNAEIKYPVLCEGYLFQPCVGSFLEGTVNQISPDHIGCIVHQYFNATIKRPENEDHEHWTNRCIDFKDTIKFRVKDLDYTSTIPYIEGELLDAPTFANGKPNKYRIKLGQGASSESGFEDGIDVKKPGKKKRERLSAGSSFVSSTQLPPNSSPSDSGLDFGFITPILRAKEKMEFKDKMKSSPLSAVHRTNVDSPLAPSAAKEEEINAMVPPSIPLKVIKKSPKNILHQHDNACNLLRQHELQSDVGDKSQRKKSIKQKGDSKDDSQDLFRQPLLQKKVKEAKAKHPSKIKVKLSSSSDSENPSKIKVDNNSVDELRQRLLQEEMNRLREESPPPAPTVANNKRKKNYDSATSSKKRKLDIKQEQNVGSVECQVPNDGKESGLWTSYAKPRLGERTPEKAKPITSDERSSDEDPNKNFAKPSVEKKKLLENSWKGSPKKVVEGTQKKAKKVKNKSDNTGTKFPVKEPIEPDNIQILENPPKSVSEKSLPKKRLATAKTPKVKKDPLARKMANCLKKLQTLMSQSGNSSLLENMIQGLRDPKVGES